ncbi:hypothetical protein ACHWQZ_G005557 [Mnemiopsis leidyi]
MIFLAIVLLNLTSRSFAAIRERVTDEITPASAEHSATDSNDDASYGAGLAIDLDLATFSYTVPGSDGTIWLKVTLDRVRCVRQVLWHNAGAVTPALTWTCSETGCSNCVGSICSNFKLSVSSEGAVSDLPPVSDCIYGDTVNIQRVDDYYRFGVAELAIVGNPDCYTVDPGLNIVINDSQLPAEDETEVKYSCRQNSDILDANVKAVCADGKISLSPENISPCRETST